jgi:hypothetical protein
MALLDEAPSPTAPAAVSAPSRNLRRCMVVSFVCGKFLWRHLSGLVKLGKVITYLKEYLVMDPMPKMSREEYLAIMRQKMEATLGQVADAINNAPDGFIISGSEEKVRDLFADVRQQAFELGLQMRVDAAEAAFSPSEALPDRQEPSQ